MGFVGFVNHWQPLKKGFYTVCYSGVVLESAVEFISMGTTLLILPHKLGCGAAKTVGNISTSFTGTPSSRCLHRWVVGFVQFDSRYRKKIYICVLIHIHDSWSKICMYIKTQKICIYIYIDVLLVFLCFEICKFIDMYMCICLFK
jgi:hypothetical protein